MKRILDYSTSGPESPRRIDKIKKENRTSRRDRGKARFGRGVREEQSPERNKHLKKTSSTRPGRKSTLKRRKKGAGLTKKLLHEDGNYKGGTPTTRKPKRRKRLLQTTACGFITGINNFLAGHEGKKI